jgi:hypothetical protein
MAVDRFYGEFYGFYKGIPEYFGYTLAQGNIQKFLDFVLTFFYWLLHSSFCSLSIGCATAGRTIRMLVGW